MLCARTVFAITNTNTNTKTTQSWFRKMHQYFDEQLGTVPNAIQLSFCGVL